MTSPPIHPRDLASARRIAMDLLISAARPDASVAGRNAAVDLLERVPDDVLLELSRQHGADGLLFELLRDLDVGRPPLMKRLRRRHERSVRRHERALEELASVSVMLAGVEDWAVFKGPVLVEEAYGAEPGRRAYYDIDLLVRPRAFPDALAALERAGATVMDRNWRMLRRDLRGEVLVRMPSGTGVDVHWHLFNMYRRRTRLDPVEIAERLRPIHLGGVDVRTLDHEDGLIHLALHAALSGGDRLSWLKDIELATRAWRPDWNLVSERSRRWRIAPAVGLMLQRSRDVLDAPIPDELTSELVSRSVGRAARWVDHRWPWAFGMDRTSSPSRVFTRGIVHGLPGAAAWIAWRSIRNLDPRQEQRSSAFRGHGGDRDRRRFLQRVAATDPAGPRRG